MSCCGSPEKDSSRFATVGVIDGAKGWENCSRREDTEIAELGEKLEDQDRMLTALWHVLKKRELVCLRQDTRIDRVCTSARAHTDARE